MTAAVALKRCLAVTTSSHDVSSNLKNVRGSFLHENEVTVWCLYGAGAEI